jgi:hypothetical protein
MKTESIRKLSLALLALVPLAVGCTNKQGESEAPVFVTVDIPEQPGFVDVCANPALPAVQFTTITLTSHFKRPLDTDPQGFATATMNTYTVTYSRLDTGTRVPTQETFSVGCNLPAGGTCSLNNFPAMYGSALTQSPFDQLLPFNGGIDLETGNREIDIGATFRFYGETASGQRLVSEPVTAPLIFSCSVAP